jgi:hypothetical protein
MVDKQFDSYRHGNCKSRPYRYMQPKTLQKNLLVLSVKYSKNESFKNILTRIRHYVFKLPDDLLKTSAMTY